MNKDCNGCFGAAGDDCQKCQEEAEKSRKEETQKLFEEVKRGKKWSEVTSKEIIKLKHRQCSRCYYFSKANSGSISIGLCDYISITGHSRGCSPLDCKKKGIFKEKERKRRK